MEAWASSEPNGLMRYLADSDVEVESSARRQSLPGTREGVGRVRPEGYGRLVTDID